MCVCELVPATTGRRVEGPGGDVPRARLSHPGLSEGMTREFLSHAGRVLSRRNRRLLAAADFLTREDVAAEMRLLDRRGRLEMAFLDASWERGAA